ncbi:unnamed protein product [Arabis nemorensis]|uniref:Uncharacterized protein n=1 Tax=Arabis nemorensis TaxID=586526 RepID=A0A565BV36_9BRAS|nr:unnamed protein product [Arabis nemorensis]
MACVSEEQENTGPWYFDGGSSSHMVGTMTNLLNIKKVKGENMTFRDGGHRMPQLKEGDKNMCGPSHKEKHVKAHHMKVPDFQSQSDLKGPNNNVDSDVQYSLEGKSGSEEQPSSEQAVA